MRVEFLGENRILVRELVPAPGGFGIRSACSEFAAAIGFATVIPLVDHADLNRENAESFRSKLTKVILFRGPSWTAVSFRGSGGNELIASLPSHSLRLPFPSPSRM